jgi:nitroreductase
VDLKTPSAPGFGWSPDQEIPADSTYGPAARLAAEFSSVPAVLVGFSRGASDFSDAVYPTVQNMLLAARALGVGSVLTTLHPPVMDRVDRLFNVPEGTKFHCCVPLGYRRGNFGTTQRLPMGATTCWNRWGDPPPW